MASRGGREGRTAGAGQDDDGSDTRVVDYQDGERAVMEVDTLDGPASGPGNEEQKRLWRREGGWSGVGEGGGGGQRARPEGEGRRGRWSAVMEMLVEVEMLSLLLWAWAAGAAEPERDLVLPAGLATREVPGRTGNGTGGQTRREARMARD
jgi:hypothetical protein